MTFITRKPDAERIDDVAQLLSRIADTSVSPHQADEFIDEISQLLWAVSSLDPDAEDLLKHSDYVADLVAESPR